MAYFAVRLEHGPAWLAGRGLEEQGDWSAHAEFMDCLLADGLVVLGGPVGEDALGAGGQVLLIFDAESEAAIRSRLADDPWHTWRAYCASARSSRGRSGWTGARPDRDVGERNARSVPARC